MAPPLLFDISGINLNQLQYGTEEIEKINPHRGVMRLLDGVVYMDVPTGRTVGFHEVRHDAFWVDGHIPGRPLMPGVLMIELAAQIASFYTLHHLPEIKFLGFVGASDVKFRGQVEPGDRLIVLGVALKVRPRRSICKAQCLVDGTIVFEGTITGMAM